MLWLSVLFCFPGLLASPIGCLQQVLLGKGLGAHSGLRSGYIIRLTQIKISWVALGREAVHLAPKTVPGLPTHPDLDALYHSVTATPKLQTHRPQTSTESTHVRIRSRPILCKVNAGSSRTL